MDNRSSPIARINKKQMIPVIRYDKTIDGPATWIVLPAPKNRPVPIVPPRAIICTCRLFRLRSIVGSCCLDWFIKSFHPFQYHSLKLESLLYHGDRRNKLKVWVPIIIYIIVLAYFISRSLRQPHHGWQYFTLISCWIYAFAIGCLCFTPAHYNWGSVYKIFFYFHGVPYNIIPFQALSMEFVLNIVMTIPAGCYAFFSSRHHSKFWPLLLGLAIGCGIETSQFLINLVFGVERFADIDDIITNFLGVQVGFLLTALFNRTGLHHWFDELKL